MDADAQPQGPRGRLHWILLQSLLNVYGAAHRCGGILECQKEGIAHGAHFLAPMRLVARAHQLEVWRLHLRQIGVIPLAIVSPQRSVALRRARFHHVREHHG